LPWRNRRHHCRTFAAFVWYENLTRDVDAAIAFYRAVIGWNTQSWAGMGEPYHMFANGDAVLAA